MVGRILTFRRAEGVVAVVQEEEAYPIPFRVEALAGDEACFRDAAGGAIMDWEREAEAVWEVIERYRVVVDVDLGAAADAAAFTGGSFALPLLLAAQYDNQRFFDPLSVLVTGALRNGCVVSVQGLAQKTDLARRMGVGLFVAPSHDEAPQVPGMHTLGITPGTQWQEAVEQFHGALQHTGLCCLSIPLARRGIAMLTRGSATGRIASTQARTQCERLLAFLRANFQPVLATSIHHGELLLASIDNHEGFPERAIERLQKLMKDRQPGVPSHEWLSAMTHLVVSLCESGRLEESEALGRRLVCDVDTLFAEDTDKGLEMRASVYGSAGGQGLLQLALRTGDSSLAGESLQLLLKSGELSTRLYEFECGLEGPVDYSGGVSRGAVQVALWRALFAPDSTEDAVAEAVSNFPPKPDRLSGELLRRVRFLGAYRNWLTSGSIPEYRGWEDELPSQQAPAWVLASALKYRGSLRAADRRWEEAQQDFCNALEALQKGGGGMIRVITWSTAVQALQFFGGRDKAPYFEGVALACLPSVLAYLGCSESAREIYKGLEADPLDLTLGRRFQAGFAY
jgi:hypothetical protein